MKKHNYKTSLSTFHTIYRLVTTSTSTTNFSAGICRLYKNTFKCDRALMLCQHVDSTTFMKTRLENNRQHYKKGGWSILTSREKEILCQEKQIILPNRLISPLVFSDCLGLIYIKRNPHMPDFSNFEKKLFFTLSEQVSTALKILHQYREEQKTIFSYIKSLTNILEQFVPTSSLHVKSILPLIKSLAKELKLSETETKSLEYASLLHDTGKIQVPHKLLNKQKPLTEEEFKIIMKHPRKGADMLKNVELMKPVIPIILHHHERYDGKGYPSRLKKEQIPVGSRILAVIDAFDAMYFGRPYKKRLSMKEINEELLKEANKQFDPAVVNAFMLILQRKPIRKYLHLP